MWVRLAGQSALLCVAGAGLGLAVNAASAHGVRLGEPVHPASAAVVACTDPQAAPQRREHPRIALQEAVRACEDCTAGFVDARGAVAFAHGHVPDAVHLPPEGHEDALAAIEQLRRFDRVIVYDDSEACELAQGVADRLVAAGLPDVRMLDGCWSDWEAARAPAEAGACGSCTAARATLP